MAPIFFGFIGDLDAIIGERANAQNKGRLAVDAPALGVLQDGMNHAPTLQKHSQPLLKP